MKDKRESPKILILSRGVWDDTDGTSSTLTNLFKDYDPDKLAQVYIETKKPNTRCCHHFFQISEFSLVYKLFRWRTKTGHTINSNHVEEMADDKIASQEAATMKYAREKRSILFSLVREVLWSLKGWRTKELKEFVSHFSPDVIWVNGATTLFLCKLYNYILSISDAHAAIYMQDDDWSYNSNSLLRRCIKWYHRKEIRKLVNKCEKMFVISPKMKREYDKVFHLNSILLTKSVDVTKLSPPKSSYHKPLKMVYMGQIIYGRIFSLLAISNAIRDLNKEEIITHLDIYTANSIPDRLKEQLSTNESVTIHAAVKYEQVQKVISEHDVVVFVESFEPDYCKVARLSFSTKITDYLSSGKCIFAVGPKDIAPIEYFIEKDAALVATTKEEIKQQLLKLTDFNLITSYARKAYDCVCNNHNREILIERLYEELRSLKS